MATGIERLFLQKKTKVTKVAAANGLLTLSGFSGNPIRSRWRRRWGFVLNERQINKMWFGERSKSIAWAGICTSCRAIVMYLLGVGIMYFLTGCSFPSPQQGREYRLTISDNTKISSPYPCVSIGVVATTPWHMYEDPLKSPYSYFSVYQLDVVLKKGDNFWTTPYREGMGSVFMMRHQKSEEIIFAPGFNPVGSSGRRWLSIVNDEEYGSDPSFWQEYIKLRQINGEWEKDFREVEKKVESHKSVGEQLEILLIPLYGINPASGIRRNLVNHSLLVWLLERKDLWSDLRGFYRKKDSREGVRLAAETVRQMVEAHEERWPEYSWSRGQKKIIDWCREVAAGETEN